MADHSFASLLDAMPPRNSAPKIETRDGTVRLVWDHGLRVGISGDEYRVVDPDAGIAETTTDPAEAAALARQSAVTYLSKPWPRMAAHILEILPCSPQSMLATLGLGTGTAMIAATMAYGATGDVTPEQANLVIPTATVLGGGGSMYVVARVLKVLELLIASANNGIATIGSVAGIAERWTTMAEKGKLPALKVQVHHQGTVKQEAVDED